MPYILNSHGDMTRRDFAASSGTTLAAILVGATPLMARTESGALSQEVIAENRQLDQRLIEAHDEKNTEKVLSCFSKRADIFFIIPSGVLVRGRAAIREGYSKFFASLDSIRGEIKEVSYIPVGESAIGLGTVYFYRRFKNGLSEKRTVIWTDCRIREGGNWVYLFRHAHWPLEGNAQPAAKASTKSPNSEHR
jgi:uncharacterized protein DUF4440